MKNPLKKIIKPIKKVNGKVVFIVVGIVVAALSMTIAISRSVNGDHMPVLSSQGYGKWKYTSESGDIRVSLIAAEYPNIPTVEYRYGKSGMFMTLLGEPNMGPATVQGDKMRGDTLVLLGVKPDTDIEYKTIEGGLKENIVLNKRKAAEDNPSGPSYAFAIVMDNAYPAKDKDGKVRPYFVNGNGEYVFHLPEPFMVDAKGERSLDIEVRIRPTVPSDPWFVEEKGENTQWLLVMKPSSAWLLDENRKFPIKVDPTILRD